MEARTRCPNCGSDVEPLAFCGVCGKRLPEPGREADRSPRGRLMAGLTSVRARPVTSLVVAAAIVVFLLLLGDRAGLATLVALLVGPGLLIHYLNRLDLYEREPRALMAGVVAAGGVLGLLGGWLSSTIFDRFWFTDPGLNLGAVGFSGIAANGREGVPFGVLLLNGLLIPVLAGAAVLVGAILLRRWPAFSNEVMDGMTLGGLAASGFATITAFVYFWPSVFDDLPDRPVSQWTALLAGTVVIRPVVLILAGSLLGIATWRYLSTRDTRGVLVAGIAGVFGWLALPIGSLVLARSGAVAEFIWYAVVLIVVGVLFRQALAEGLARDGAVLAPAEGQQRVVCPTCHRVTPDGTFCSFCRAPLHEPAPAALATPRQSATRPTMGHPTDPEPETETSTPEPTVADHPAEQTRTFAPVIARDGATAEVSGSASDDADESGESREVRPGRPVGVGLEGAAGTPDIGHDQPTDLPMEEVTDGNDDLQWRPDDRGDADRTTVTGSGDPFGVDDRPWVDDTTRADDDWIEGPAGRTVKDAEPLTPDVTSEVSYRGEDQDLDDHAVPGARTGASTDVASDGPGSAEDAAADTSSDRSALDPDPAYPSRDGMVAEDRVGQPRSGDEPGRAPATVQPDDEAWRLAARDDPATVVMGNVPVPSLEPPADTLTSSTEREVSSSSGRWFEASSGRPADSRTDSTTQTGPESEPVAATSREPIPLFPPASPVGLDRDGDGSGERVAPEPDAIPPRPTPPGLRWYRSEGEGPPALAGTPDGVSRERPLETSVAEGESSTPEPSVEPKRSDEPGTGRHGLWRQLTRGGRSTGPRAPQRDHDRQTAEPVNDQGPGQSGP